MTESCSLCKKKLLFGQARRALECVLLLDCFLCLPVQGVMYLEKLAEQAQGHKQINRKLKVTLNC